MDMYYYTVECVFNYLNIVDDMKESYHTKRMNLFQEFITRLNKITKNKHGI